MSKDKNKKDVQSGLEDIHIDYENINVEDIMEQIKKDSRPPQRPGVGLGTGERSSAVSLLGRG